MNFGNKLILTFLFYGTLLTSFTLAIVYLKYENDLNTINSEKSIYKYKHIQNYFDSQINTYKLTLKSLISSKIFLDYIQNNNNIDITKNLFLDITKANADIMQLRYINKDGFEKIRIDKKLYKSNAYIVDEKNLQNKKNRYYFNNILYLKKDKDWFSKIDLNIENGKIEIPYKAVLRYGLAVFNNGEKVGILIINIFMEEILANLTNDASFETYIIDNEGYFISHNNTIFNFSRYTDKKNTISSLLKKESEEILTSTFFMNNYIYSNSLEFDNGENLKIILKAKSNFDNKIEELQETILILLAVLLFSLPLAYFFTVQPKKIKDELDSFNHNLEDRIKKRTSALSLSNKKLQKISTIDFLTDIPNRRYFFTMGKKLFASSRRHDINLCMIVLDIDFFKSINDEYGHKVGDEVLKHISSLLSKGLREEDILARIGGEEFALIFFDIKIQSVQIVAEKIRELIEVNTYSHKNRMIKSTISLGIAQINEKDIDISCVYDRADKALYEAKNGGRNCVKTIS